MSLADLPVEANCVLDEQGRIVTADAAARAWFGDVVGHSLDRIISGRGVMAAHRRVVEHGCEATVEVDLNYGRVDASMRLRLRRLEGSDERLVLATIAATR